MPATGPAETVRTESCVPPELSTALIDDLRKIVAPITECCKATIAFVSPTETRWLTPHSSCPCSQCPGPAIPCQNGIKVRNRENHIIPVPYQGLNAVHMVTCCESSQTGLADALEALVKSSVRHWAEGAEVSRLRGQLHASGDSLSAFYDIGAQLRTVQDATELLNSILRKLGSLKNGLQAVLWLEREDWLEPLAAKNTPAPESRPSNQGLLGEAAAGKQIIALSGRAEIAAKAREPELARAASLAIMPISNRHGSLAVLEVWHETDECAFDARLIQVMETLAFLVALVVENDRLHRTSSDTDRIRHDIEIASRIQQTLLLGKPPLDLQMLRAAALTIPSWQIDGDFYDFYAHNDYLDVIVGDVMGKGIPAALVGAATKHHFLRASNHLLSAHPDQLPEPKQILTIVNEELVRQLVGIESFVTLCYARFKFSNQTMQYIDCGHTRTIVSRGRGGPCEFLQGENMPLGFSQTDVYKQFEVAFGPGDVFFFYSDGITEAKSPKGEYFGEARLAQTVHAHNALDPKDLVEKIRKDLSLFTHSESHRDDLTCVAVKIQDVQATLAGHQDTLEIVSDLKELPRVRSFLRNICSRYFNLDNVVEDMAQIELAMTEAISNIMIHAYQRQSDRPIRIRTDLFVNRLLIRIYHRGQSFDPEKVEKPNLDNPRENRMGMHIIRECMDQVRYYSAEHGENCVHLVKIFRAQPKS